MMSRLISWLDLPAEQAGRLLLGCELVRTINGQTIRVRIVEVEAYDQDDEASHAFVGRTKRNQIMFAGAGHLYVYLSYGIHYCCNIVCGPADYGSGVLIRAVEPIEGLELMSQRRGLSGHANLSNGPGKLTQALGIDLSLNGHFLGDSPLQLIKRPPLQESQIVATKRIGISRAIDRPRRFYIKNNPFVSAR